MEDHSQAYGGCSDPAGTLTALPKHQDGVDEPHAIQHGRNSKPD
jgi:hypothetical protein